MLTPQARKQGTVMVVELVDRHGVDAEVAVPDVLIGSGERIEVFAKLGKGQAHLPSELGRRQRWVLAKLVSLECQQRLCMPAPDAVGREAPTPRAAGRHHIVGDGGG